MKIIKIITGIVSIIISIIIFIQSLMAGFLSDLFNLKEPLAAVSGLIVATIMLGSGVATLFTLTSPNSGLICSALYVDAAIIGYFDHDFFSYLILYASFCVIFALILILTSIEYIKRGKALI